MRGPRPPLGRGSTRGAGLIDGDDPSIPDSDNTNGPLIEDERPRSSDLGGRACTALWTRCPSNALKDHELRVSFLRPNCKSARITVEGSQTTDDWNRIECRKCHAHIFLDSIKLVVIKEGLPPSA